MEERTRLGKRLTNVDHRHLYLSRKRYKKSTIDNSEQGKLGSKALTTAPENAVKTLVMTIVEEVVFNAVFI